MCSPSCRDQKKSPITFLFMGVSMWLPGEETCCRYPCASSTFSSSAGSNFVLCLAWSVYLLCKHIHPISADGGSCCSATPWQNMLYFLVWSHITAHTALKAECACRHLFSTKLILQKHRDFAIKWLCFLWLGNTERQIQNPCPEAILAECALAVGSASFPR